MNTVAVIYLARCAEGLDAFRRFIESYRSHDAGMPHDLVIIYKGYEQASELLRARELFSDVPHTGIEVDDTGFDIGVYLKAANQIGQDYVCFLNTFTEISVAGWLAKLHAYAKMPQVGLVGAMGSYESLFDSVRLIHKVLWLCNVASIPFEEPMAYYYDFIINDHCKYWRSKGTIGSRPSQVVKLRQDIDRAICEYRFRRHWHALISPGGSLNFYASFPPFPNPHVRSNGFMISRQRILQFGPSRIEDKLQACAFESGAESLTARLRRSGMATLVVGRDGVGYDVPAWSKSSMFRVEDQSNLLLTDNQSRKFRTMAPGERVTHVRITWGDYLQPPPPDYPALGFVFKTKAGSTAPHSHGFQAAPDIGSGSTEVRAVDSSPG